MIGKNNLEMYCFPEMLKEILKGFKQNPFFQDVFVQNGYCQYFSNNFPQLPELWLIKGTLACLFLILILSILKRLLRLRGSTLMSASIIF